MKQAFHARARDRGARRTSRADKPHKQALLTLFLYK
eukprot:COSAG02_NODE_44265_length_367_cov_2.686567_1_plen_35_part_10